MPVLTTPIKVVSSLQSPTDIFVSDRAEFENRGQGLCVICDVSRCITP